MTLTKEQKAISKKNRKIAIKHFEEIGLLPLDRGPNDYALHHINPDWRHNDIERYIQWNPEDLVVITSSEHTILHNHDKKGKKTKPCSEERKRKLSESNKGKHDNAGKNNPMYGKKQSEESKQKNREAHLGKTQSEESNLKRSLALKGRIPWNKGLKKGAK